MTAASLATATLVRLGEITNRTLVLPLVVYYPTSRCNSRCISCDWWRQTGVVLHMVSGVADLGRFGFTAIAESAAKADELYQHALRVFDEEAQAALQPKR